jgi:DUF1680 family protein
MERPVLSRPAGLRLALGGVLGDRLAANETHWLLSAPDANPGMLQLLRDRDRLPVRDLVPWAGEFAGKYLTAAVLGLRLTGSAALGAYLTRFVADLIATQSADGYLGAFPRAYRLTGKTVKPDGSETRTWDAWNHYHCLLGLLLWHETTGDAAALDACRRAADLFCRLFLDGGRRLVATGSEEMNLAPVHVFCLLYARTGEARYLQMARAIEADFETPPAGDYVRTALAGQDFFETPKPRWESLHPIQGIAELYWITGDERYRRAFEHIWWSIARTDRHNTGGFSAGEKAQGNPYDPRPIETCCTVAWVVLGVDMLRLGGDPLVADELELATFNAVLGAQSPSGRWWTYNTPMDGVRLASAHDIVFQARAGTPELNCCSVNGPRALAAVGEWALLHGEDGTTLSYYGPGAMTFPTPDGVEVTLTQETDYPVGPSVTLRVEPRRPAAFPLRLRIPRWSESTRVRLNGEDVSGVVPGSYLALRREWRPGDRIDLSFDFALRAWAGEREAAGRAALYRGPLLLAYDQRLNALDPGPLLLDLKTRANRLDPGALPVLSPARVRAARRGAIDPALAAGTGAGAPLLTLRVPTERGDLVLCDFASAGAAGTPYLSWLPFEGLAPVAFSRQNPLRQVPL